MKNVILYVFALWLLGRAVDNMIKDAEQKAYQTGYLAAQFVTVADSTDVLRQS
jgi:hypothetical protein